ncbi:hypothetical protein LWC34_35635 [Kibdelosporangium philippinense]|uniref:Phospholipase/carboxylesterase/thioesterase domain-containing protein n=1 Tax=Kibdelosporangium philippinense TaxID=211113 RepID=A0ABS8ZLT0_9PSEU|nr:hypothetical protein [Kibdelosporangium philippinense]MCE7008113.1 hypothetical protein [Kibdelosporangium philippinense]
MYLVTNDGTRLYAEADGPSDARMTVIFCHGIGDSLATWAAQRAQARWRSCRPVSSPTSQLP